MPLVPLSYPDWKAPREDGEILVSPAAPELLARTLENHRRLSSESTVTIQNVPLNELRRRVREWLGFDHAQPLIADGHQTELHHPGVWVKRILTDAVAAKLGGRAVHFAVDTDAPRHLELRWPGHGGPITDDPDLRSAHWAGAVDAPTPAHVEQLQSSLAVSPYAASPVETNFLPTLRRLALEQPNLAAALSNAMHDSDWSLGLRHHVMLASPVWEGELFGIFAHHLIARAGAFAAGYNAALADYRREKKIRTITRPMPDLAAFAGGGGVELPFWLDQLDTGDRTRPSAFARDGGYVLAAPGGEGLGFDPAADGFDAGRALAAWLRRNRLRLSPRALTLTMFLRLCCADQFVHGIGGGQYDQVTDRIIASHFNLRPPAFAVATGTMYLPEAVGRARACVPCVEQEGHRLKHALLGERKQEYVRRIAAAPRGSAERYAAFADMHRQLSAAVMTDPRMRQWSDRLRETREREQEEASLFDRELFYALQPRERLEEMVARFRAAVASA
jgi:hypothetical protein